MRRILAMGLGVVAVAACDRGGEPEARPEAAAAQASAPAGAEGGPAALGAARTFGDWTASCDNIGDCTAFGFQTQDESGGAFIRLNMPAGGAAAPVIHATTGEPDGEVSPEPAAVTVRVAGSGGASATLPRVTMDAPSGYLGKVQGPEAARLVQAVGDARAVQVSAPGMPARTVSLNGAAAALLWIDERQGRVGTTAALRARGDKPPKAGPGPRPVPVVTRAKLEGRRTGALPRPTALWSRPEVTACREGFDQDPELVVEALGKRANLYGVPCYSGAYNLVSLFFVSDAEGGDLRPAPLEGLGPEEDGTLVNADFDRGTLTLSEFNKGRGVGDCGVDRAWTWDGSRFRLTRHSRMDLCRGLAPGLWPELHRVEVR